MVMVQRRCTTDEALTALSTESQQRDIKLLDLCAELVAGQTPATPLQQPPPR
ncbi:ANTAR domain-containing protein [Streptomyces sp. NBC_01558]|uniref:ANTAR domain-containing protein n=1 Tax=Streptomyces sp. NBC_01558 TaxID=2975878 RepID=UPI002DDBC8FB|nr:ANTAR domain-containing protein [Streptomyces sp. NBC_01558]WSD81609.1 ANTAR domain-containing protein [Streptomyces sp. NBC_01558]